MATKTKTSTPVAPSYVDFEPYCEWKNDEGTETLVIHLPDFKKDQLRVQVNNLGVLKVSGERALDGTYKTRFLKETKTPENCDINDIRAKFTNGHLHVIMPKKAQPAAAHAQQHEEQPASTSSAEAQATKSQISQEPKSEAPVPNDQKVTGPSTGSGQMQTMAADDQPQDQMFGFGSSLARFRIGKKVNVSLGIAIVAMVAIGAYAAYKCGSDTTSSSSSSSSESTRIEGRD